MRTRLRERSKRVGSTRRCSKGYTSKARQGNKNDHRQTKQGYATANAEMQARLRTQGLYPKVLCV